MKGGTEGVLRERNKTHIQVQWTGRRNRYKATYSSHWEGQQSLRRPEADND